jgi:protein-S-isoprenylcysteine O-methyltransferase Ste14
MASPTARKSVVLSVFVTCAVGALMVGILFGCAARWDLPFFWIFVGVMTAMTIASLMVVDPSLVRERFRPGPGAMDTGFTLAFVPFALSQFAVAGLDVGRFHWGSTVPQPVQIGGLLAVPAAVAVAVWAVAVNPFFSSVIRIQTDRAHRLVTRGPYRWVRHPAYAAAPFLFVGTGLMLGCGRPPGSACCWSRA